MFKEKIMEILENGSSAFAKLKGITEWKPETILSNLDIIIDAVKDGFSAIDEVRSSLGTLVNDEEAQEDLAKILDDAIQLNAMLEVVDGMVFSMIIKTACLAIKPFLGEEEK